MQKQLKLAVANPIFYILSLSFVLYLPSLFSGWSFVDDGLSAFISSKLTDAFLRTDWKTFISLLLGPAGSGRFMPFYWIYLWFTFLLSGYTNPLWQHLIQYLTFLAFIGIFYIFVYKLYANKWVSFLSSLFLITNVITVQDWYRPGPQEARLTLFILIYYFLWIKFVKSKKIIDIILSFVFLFAAFLMKETSIVLIPLSLLLLFYQLIVNKLNFKKSFLYFINLVFAVFLGILVIKMTNHNTGYASNYSINLRNIIGNFAYLFNLLREGYFPLIEISFIIFSYRIFSYFSKNKLIKSLKYFKYDLFAISFFLGYTLVISPWSYTLDRYLLPGVCALFIFLAVQIIWLFNFSKNKVKSRTYKWLTIIRIYLIVSILFALTYQVMQSINYVNWLLKYNTVMRGLDVSLDNIYKNKSSSNFYLNLDNGGKELEIFDAIPMHMSVFYGNKYMTLNYLPKNYRTKTNDIIISANGTEIIPDDQLLTQKLSLLRGDGISFTNYSIVNPYLLYRNSFKLLKGFVLQKSLPELIIGTYYKYFWKIYAYKY